MTLYSYREVEVNNTQTGILHVTGYLIFVCVVMEKKTNFKILHISKVVGRTEKCRNGPLLVLSPTVYF